MKLRNSSKGFTLVELLLVIAIIGILAAVIFIVIGPARKKARIATFKEHMVDLVKAGASCIDSEGEIRPGQADGTHPFCTDGAGNPVGGLGNIPTIKYCSGGSQTVEINVENGNSDDFEITADCPVTGGSGGSGGVTCYAKCTINGCEFSNDPNFSDASLDGCPQI